LKQRNLKENINTIHQLPSNEIKQTWTAEEAPISIARGMLLLSANCIAFKYSAKQIHEFGKDIGINDELVPAEGIIAKIVTPRKPGVRSKVSTTGCKVSTSYNE
jgi:hypothetical protein